MIYLEILGPILVALGILSALIMALALRLALRKADPPMPSSWPSVSILKPLKGVDPELEENLSSFFDLDYPDYEVVMGMADADDPAFEIATSISDKTKVPAKIFASSKMIGCNPKVNNLSNLCKEACHELILISDSNVRVEPGYLKNLVAQRIQAGGGLVWSVFRGTGWRGFWGGVESLQLNGMVMGGMSGLHQFLKMPCALGKSMLLDRSDLRAIGGLESMAEYLAEDQIMAEEMVRAGRPVSLSNRVIDNVLGPRDGAGFVARHLRWSRLRRHLNLAGYLGEALLNPIFLSLVFFGITRNPGLLAASVLAILGMSVIDSSTERLLKVKRSLWTYPVTEIALALARGFLWFVPFFSNTVVWRGNRLALGPRSRITPMDKSVSVIRAEYVKEHR